jgi:hypothetical protein
MIVCMGNLAHYFLYMVSPYGDEIYIRFLTLFSGFDVPMYAYHPEEKSFCPRFSRRKQYNLGFFLVSVENTLQ